jgi:hypothetical protein
MACSAIYFLDMKGKVLVGRNYRGDIENTVIDKFIGVFGLIKSLVIELVSQVLCPIWRMIITLVLSSRQMSAPLLTSNTATCTLLPPPGRTQT